VKGRDFGRVDFFRDGDRFYFLEINTIPGLTSTSLLPKSASVCGIDFTTLVRRMLTPALARFHCRKTDQNG
jgi:D-alanine-D-alanine ligase